jgi:hypothetical protein
MKIFYTLALALLLATTAQAQSHTNPVGEKAMETEIRKNERWRVFYDSLTVEERNNFIAWWRNEMYQRQDVNPVNPDNSSEYNREFRGGLQKWYRDEVNSFEEKRQMEQRYNTLWDKRQQEKEEARKPKPMEPRKTTTIKVYDAGEAPVRDSGSRYYTR